MHACLNHYSEVGDVTGSRNSSGVSDATGPGCADVARPPPPPPPTITMASGRTAATSSPLDHAPRLRPGAPVATLHHACTAAGTELPYSTWAVPYCTRARVLGPIRVAQEEEDAQGRGGRQIQIQI